MYTGFLMSEIKSTTCTKLSEIMGISHDSVNRFLERENYSPKDLFNEAKALINMTGGTLSVDDSVLDKPYSYHMSLVGYFWSGKHHKVVKGLNLISLYYTDLQGNSVPLNYRIYNKAEGKTKNHYFQEMTAEVLEWGLNPKFVSGDTWYAGVPNLKMIRKHHMGFMFAIESNRLVSVVKGNWSQVKILDIPEDGLLVWLKDFGNVKLFRTCLKDQHRHYIVFHPEEQTSRSFKNSDFKRIHDQHWGIEMYHRMLKQVCNIERFQVRKERSIRNHIFVALLGYIKLKKMRLEADIVNAYQWRINMYKEATKEFIQSVMNDFLHLDPQLKKSVNA
jgi:hypothetical protein